MEDDACLGIKVFNSDNSICFPTGEMRMSLLKRNHNQNNQYLTSNSHLIRQSYEGFRFEPGIAIFACIQNSDCFLL